MVVFSTIAYCEVLSFLVKNFEEKVLKWNHVIKSVKSLKTALISVTSMKTIPATLDKLVSTLQDLESEEDLEEFCVQSKDLLQDLSEHCKELTLQNNKNRMFLLRVLTLLFHHPTTKVKHLQTIVTEEALEEMKMKMKNSDFCWETWSYMQVYKESGPLVSVKDCLDILQKGTTELDDFYMTLSISRIKENLSNSIREFYQSYKTLMDGSLQSMTNHLQHLISLSSQDGSLKESHGDYYQSQPSEKKTHTMKQDDDTSSKETESSGTSEPSKKKQKLSQSRNTDISTYFTLADGTTPIAGTSGNISTWLNDIGKSELWAPSVNPTSGIHSSICRRTANGSSTTKVPVDKNSDLYIELNVYNLREYAVEKKSERWKTALVRMKFTERENSPIAKGIMQLVKDVNVRLQEHPERETYQRKTY
ncbi:NS2 [Helicoverpa armigera densovirus]|uniref:NS2 n=1 Tax=Helicoverpa armigera densovirus TaxID=1045778 RepID=F8S8R3_9VIRU|nr:NS2 [Helicoverpa armigera densovirus]AEI26262.1 NS2 [Helicoverpa armigera densovirus]